jgi:hypothetical protein
VFGDPPPKPAAPPDVPKPTADEDAAVTANDAGEVAMHAADARAVDEKGAPDAAAQGSDAGVDAALIAARDRDEDKKKKKDGGGGGGADASNFEDYKKWVTDTEGEGAKKPDPPPPAPAPPPGDPPK